jgi:hypothetical protein
MESYLDKAFGIAERNEEVSQRPKTMVGRVDMLSTQRLTIQRPTGPNKEACEPSHSTLLVDSSLRCILCVANLQGWQDTDSAVT